MSLIKWSPFFEPFEDFDSITEKLMGTGLRSGKDLVPAIDVYDQKDAVIVETPLPGVDPKDVDLSIKNGMLTISGNSERTREVDEKNYYRKEIRRGSFMRQVALPAGVQEEQAKAAFENGILKVRIPKLQEPQAKTITIDIETHE